MFSFLQKFINYMKGLSVILHDDAPRYNFLLKKINIIYNDKKVRAEAEYMPIGAFRSFKKEISSLNEVGVLTKFKLNHSRIIIGISTLEVCLDFSSKEQYEIYLNFVKSCQNALDEEVVQ